MAYERMSDDEVAKVAIGLVNGAIFTSDMVPVQSDIQHVFMFLALMGEEHFAALKEDGIAMVYEELSKAGSMSVNGMPCFLSMHVTNEEDRTRIYTAARAIKAAQDAALAALRSGS